MQRCDPEKPDPMDNLKWACTVLSEAGTTGGEAPVSEGDAVKPACKDVSDSACLKDNCSVSDGGPKGDCRKTWCCSQPGTQCFEQNDYWASCRPSCTKGNGWSCKTLGPRTPGDPHTWAPCPKAEGAEEHPLLPDGDTVAAWDAAEARAKALLSTLELDDKVALLRGQNLPWPNDRHGYAGYINPNYYFRNKCAMPLTLNDGPQGYNHYQKKLAGTTTQFPALLSVAASFDPKVAEKYAAAIAEEFVAKGANVMLGPDVEVGRNSLSGRSFETLSGEDPYLGSQLVAPFVRELVKQGIIVTVKHWLDNNEEDFRQTMSVTVDPRAQHEIYMPVFKAAFDAGASAVMCAYNKVAGTHACENKHLLQTLLRDDLGFRGFVMSDWGATHNAELSANHGLDMEMPGGADDKFHTLPRLLKEGKLHEGTIDKMAGHVLASMYAAGHFDGKFKFASTEAALDKNVTSDEHRQVAFQTIIDSAVLLKNENATLPLDGKVKKVVLVGKYCNQKLEPSYGQGDVFSGGGSGFVMTNLAISPLEGIQAHFKDAEVTWSSTASGAKGAHVAVVCVAGHAEEGWDRANLTLPEAKELVSALRQQSKKKKIIVLAFIPGAVTTEWLEDADAALAFFMPGEQVGPAVAQLLSGAASPGGRLPVSLPAEDEQRFTPQQYPGSPFNDINMVSEWSEGVLVGYRWNDATSKPSAFPFGFGLAYTSFKFKHIKASCSHGEAVTISLTVANTGAHDGAAVPQVYIGFPSLKPALRQLRGFQKVHLSAGEKVSVAFDLASDAWSVWDEPSRKWVSAMQRGEEVTFSIGSSSADLVWSQKLRCSDAKDSAIMA